MTDANKTQKPVISRKDRRAANALLVALGCAPIKERRAPRAKVFRYVITVWTDTAERWVRIEKYTLADARQGARKFLLDDSLGIKVDLVDIAEIGNEDVALELWTIKDGKVTKK